MCVIVAVGTVTEAIIDIVVGIVGVVIDKQLNGSSSQQHCVHV